MVYCRLFLPDSPSYEYIKTEGLVGGGREEGKETFEPSARKKSGWNEDVPEGEREETDSRPEKKQSLRKLKSTRIEKHRMGVMLSLIPLI